MTKIFEIIGFIMVGLIVIKLVGIVLGLIFGLVSTALKVALYLIIGISVFYAIKKFILDK